MIDLSHALLKSVQHRFKYDISRYYDTGARFNLLPESTVRIGDETQVRSPAMDGGASAELNISFLVPELNRHRTFKPCSIAPLTAKKLDAVINRIASRWKADVAIRLVDGFTDLPAPIQEADCDQGSDGSDVYGAQFGAPFT